MRRAPRSAVPLSSLAVRDPAHEVSARDTPEYVTRTPANPFGPADDPDEETVADNLEPDEEPTTIRPTPVPPDLVMWEAATVKDDARGRRRTLGKYELCTRIARGAFGVVYTARDPGLERNVALKVLRPSHLTNHEVVQRFLREARATARIAHPGIVMIHDCGMVETRRGTTAFIAMELLSGENLTSRLARAGRLAPAEACEIVRQVASALEAAHHVDVLHRDLKPDNIFLVPDPAMPSGERVKVLDFGLAKLGDGGQTQLQIVFGTPRYMSPEQSRSATQIDHRSDIYSLGCVLFELVTGRTPFDGDVRQLIDRHQRATPPRAASLAADVPPVLDQLIAEMLAKDPMGRPQTMGAVQRALRTAMDGPSGARPRPDPAPLVLPLPPGSAPALLPVRPSSSPPVRPPSCPPVRLAAVRPPSSPPAVPPALGQGPPMPSVEISITPITPSLPEIQTDPVPLDAGAVSGEIVVPAVQPVAPPPEPAQFPEYHRQSPTLIVLCLLLIAVITAVALAATV
jgi:serine/threonine protein kinase